MPILNIATILITREVNNETEILFLNRNKPPYKDYLIFPGGKIEPGEKLTSAGIREIKEETGIKLAKTNIVAIVNEILKNNDDKIEGHFILYYFHSHIKETKILRESDEGELVWINKNDLDDYKDTIIASDYNIAKSYDRTSNSCLNRFECILVEESNGVKKKYYLEEWVKQ